jgi:hypothetical protein
MRWQFPGDGAEGEDAVRHKATMDNVLDLLGVDKIFKQVREKLNQGRDIYSAPVPKLLKSTPNTAGKPCQEQEAHYDYNVRENTPKNMMPMSCLIALHGDSTHVVIYVKYGDGNAYHKIHVHLNPGDMIIFDGYTLHCGGMYRRINMRLFAYFPSVGHPPADVVVFENTDWTEAEVHIT